VLQSTTILAAMAGSLGFVKILFLLFFFQDVFNVVLVKYDLASFVQVFSSLKEVLIVLLLAQHWLRTPLRRKLHFTSLFLVFSLALFFTVGVWRGLERFPIDGVVFELRTLALPILVFFWGKAFVESELDSRTRVEDMIGFYTNMAVVFALSAIVDYLFLSDAFWTSVDVGSVSRAKGYFATTSGALPDNMYSWFFGRRAFGLAFNPLNLAYMLIPAILFAFYRRQVVRLALATIAFILSFSRLPILATAATAVLAALPLGLRFISLGLGAIGMGVTIYAIRGALFEDPSASGHFGDVAIGLVQLVVNPLGEGIGAAGVYAGNYSSLAIESAVINTANQITLIGLIAYALVFARGLHRVSPLRREMGIMACIYGITAVFAPQILVIKSTFAFFFFLGANAALAQQLAPVLGDKGGTFRPRQPVGFGAEQHAEHFPRPVGLPSQESAD
jgi:hypothetical protein